MNQPFSLKISSNSYSHCRYYPDTPRDNNFRVLQSILFLLRRPLQELIPSDNVRNQTMMILTLVFDVGSNLICFSYTKNDYIARESTFIGAIYNKF